jgi:hypothetical protein
MTVAIAIPSGVDKLPALTVGCPMSVFDDEPAVIEKPVAEGQG